MFDQIKDLNAQRQVRGKIQEKVKSNTKTLHKQENYREQSGNTGPGSGLVLVPVQIWSSL